jgi:hypothetical protein
VLLSPKSRRAGRPWWALLLILLAVLAGCQQSRPDFMTRVQEDCAAGDAWACGLLDALARSATGDELAR